MIVLDLDDTIFATKTMNPRIFDSAISLIEQYFSSMDSEKKAQMVISDLWSKPIDHVLRTHCTPEAIIAKFYREISRIDYSTLNIKPFSDYDEVRKLPTRKFLVTTGLSELQMAKISALGIESDFEAIYIDDPRLTPRNTKSKIFKKLLLETKKSPKDIWIIGDNPASEIRAGKELGMRTVQRKTEGIARSKLADFEIQNFKELRAIIYATGLEKEHQ